MGIWKSINNVASKLEVFVSCVSVIVMSFLVFINVIARFVFNNSLAFSDEISSYLFVLMSFMGTAIAARRKAHLGLSIVTDRFSPKTRTIIGIIMYAISALFCLSIVFFGVQMVMSQYALGQESAAMQWPEWIYGSFVPIGALFATLSFVQGDVEMIEELRSGDYEREETLSIGTGTDEVEIDPSVLEDKSDSGKDQK